MNRAPFKGFTSESFDFLSALALNNDREWFAGHRRQYEQSLLDPIKSFVAEFGPRLAMLNEEFETEPRVGRTITRINNDLRFHRTRPPYRPFVYASFPRRGMKWTSEALLYVGVYSHGVTVGFYPGGYKQLRTGPVQEGIKKNLRLFQRYLDERNIAGTYSELAGGEEGAITKWPLPGTARRWVNLDSFTVGEYFPAPARAVSRRSFLGVAQEIMLDLYPLWLFATSEDIKADLDLYWENAELLARPLKRAVGSRQ